MIQPNNDDGIKKFISSLTDEQLWEAYYFLKESIERLPNVSSYKMLYILLHNFKDVDNPLYEFAKIAQRLLKRISNEIQNRNQN